MAPRWWPANTPSLAASTLAASYYSRCHSWTGGDFETILRARPASTATPHLHNALASVPLSWQERGARFGSGGVT
eukprot:1181927-Prorocentrum_minimum.AAC.6